MVLGSLDGAGASVWKEYIWYAVEDFDQYIEKNPIPDRVVAHHGEPVRRPQVCRFDFRNIERSRNEGERCFNRAFWW